MSFQNSLMLSIFLLLSGVFFHIRNGHGLWDKIVFFILLCFSIFLYTFHGVSDYFTGKGINESVIYQIKYGFSGVAFEQYSALIIISSTILFLGLLFSFLIVLKRKTCHPSPVNKRIVLSYALVLMSLAVNPAIRNLYNLISLRRTEALDFNKYYKKPSIKKLTSDPKNLIIIYAESLERTYFDEQTFPGLIKELRELESKSTYFTGIGQVPGAGWTMGGVVASQCGIPLILPLKSCNSMSGMDRFLPSAAGLSDLLYRKGYKLIYYGGANLDFAGKALFLRDHHYGEIFGQEDLQSLLTDKTYQNDWGLFDDTLFDGAFKKFIALSKQGKRFGLVLLTMDTHGPDGSPSKQCEDIRYGEGANPVLNAVACSDYLIGAFVNKILESPFAQETVIVIVSDHLAMRNSAFSLLGPKGGDRRNLFMIIDPNNLNSRGIQRRGSTLDIGPTLLPFIGYRGTIGLGRNLLDLNVQDSEIKYIQEHIYGWREDLSKFWNFPKFRKLVTIDTVNRSIGIGGRKFKIPALLKFDDDFKATLEFSFYNPWEFADQLEPDKNFMFVEECKNDDWAPDNLPQNAFCVTVGKGNVHLKRMVLDENVTLTRRDLRNIVQDKSVFRVKRVAHAGGRVEDRSYTNSFDALNLNMKKGFRYFELDFSYTKDEQLVCIHDFEGTFTGLTGIELEEKPTLQTFQSIVHDHCPFDLCTMDTLAQWMKRNPLAVIVTDIKDDNKNVEGLKMISMKLPDFKNRVIPQIYNPENYKAVKDLGYKQVIWALYRYPGTNEEVLQWVDRLEKPIAVNIPQERARTDLPARLAVKGIPSYVHTVNRLEDAFSFLQQYKVSEIYTDFLSPKGWDPDLEPGWDPDMEPLPTSLPFGED